MAASLLRQSLTLTPAEPRGAQAPAHSLLPRPSDTLIRLSSRFCRYRRWEIDPELCALAEGNIAARLRSRADKATVTCADARRADVRGADVVLLYMLPEANEVLAREVLEPQLPVGCGARVVAHTFQVPCWVPTSTRVVDSVTLYLYVR